jgi:rSAM/selenodomain-associated transferase 1
MMSACAGEMRAATCALAVMAKASIPGQTKTRLVPPLSLEEAASLNTAFLRDAADSLLAAAALASISPFMAITPAGSERFFRQHLPDSFGVLETVGADIGKCLALAAGQLLAAGHAAVCLLNSDSPTLPLAYLVAAATALDAPGDRIVLGPAADGGYYLIGMKQPHLDLFESIAWSTERVFAQTLARAEQLKLDVVQLPSWYDVDDALTLRVLIGELMRGMRYRQVGSCATAATWTRRYLAKLLESADLGARLSLPA